MNKKIISYLMAVSMILTCVFLPQSDFSRVKAEETTASSGESVVTSAEPVASEASVTSPSATATNSSVTSPSATATNSSVTSPSVITTIPGIKISGVTYKTSSSTTSAKINLNWDAIEGYDYQVYIKGETDLTDYLVATATTNSAVIKNLVTDASYSLCVRACTGSSVGEFSDSIVVNTLPADISNLRSTSKTISQVFLEWDAVAGAYQYNIYRSTDGKTYTMISSVTGATMYTDSGLTPKTKYYYKVCVWSVKFNQEGAKSSRVEVTTENDKVTTITAANTQDTVNLSWNAISTVSGYIIYRKNSDKKYVYLASTTGTTFADTGLSSAKTYSYKVCAYIGTETTLCTMSEVFSTSTLPKQPVVTTKSGDTKLRLSWKAITRADGYYVYQLQADGTYSLISNLEGKTNKSVIYDSLTNDSAYTYKVYAYRKACSTVFVSADNTEATVTPLAAAATSTTAFRYATKALLKKSAAWKKISSIADAKESYVIPGLSSTNILGFTSSKMCPQGFCFAGDYALIAAYDLAKEENSIIYVLSLSTGKLKTVLVLDNKAHAGGMCFDGDYVWVANGSNLSSIKYSKINKAAKAGAAYQKIDYSSTCPCMTTASFCTYYKDYVWVGKYTKTGNGKLYKYELSTDDNANPTLTSVSYMTIPSAVQGATFTDNKRLILSRAYGKTHQLDIYKPITSGNMSLGSALKTVSVPYLSEDMDICDDYLYVAFESSRYPSSPDTMDRVVALNLNKVLKVTKK